VTASDRYAPLPGPGQGQGIDTVFPVAAVRLDLPTTPNSFTIRARNSDTNQNGGSASFFWLAVAEIPRTTLPTPINQTFIGQPASFSATNNVGDRQQFPNIFDPTLPAAIKGGRYSFNGTFGPGPFAQTVVGRPLVFATANSVGSGPVHNAPAVALVQDNPLTQNTPIDPTGFSLIARNSDTVAGLCGFNWVALQQGLTNTLGAGPMYPPGVPPPPDLLVDTGRSLEFMFAPTNHHGDWVTAEIQFSVPFVIPPAVLITPIVRVLDTFGAWCMPVAIAQNVTRFGFTLAARNSDTNSSGGNAFFDWVAFGL
jgi:hypothetical protein